MKYTKKASKTKRNQPANFDETLAVSMDMPASISDQPRLTLRQIRLGLSVVWVAAAIIAGIGIGRMVIDARNAAIIAEPPAPIASAKVIANSSSSGTIAPAQAISAPDVKVAPAVSIAQAQAGDLFTALSMSEYQPANTPNSLQPGFNNIVRSQGNIGITPVR